MASAVALALSCTLHRYSCAHACAVLCSYVHAVLPSLRGGRCYTACAFGIDDPLGGSGHCNSCVPCRSTWRRQQARTRPSSGGRLSARKQLRGKRPWRPPHETRLRSARLSGRRPSRCAGPPQSTLHAQHSLIGRRHDKRGGGHHDTCMAAGHVAFEDLPQHIHPGQKIVSVLCVAVGASEVFSTRVFSCTPGLHMLRMLPSASPAAAAVARADSLWWIAPDASPCRGYPSAHVILQNTRGPCDPLSSTSHGMQHMWGTMPPRLQARLVIHLVYMRTCMQARLDQEAEEYAQLMAQHARTSAPAAGGDSKKKKKKKQKKDAEAATAATAVLAADPLPESIGSDVLAAERDPYAHYEFEAAPVGEQWCGPPRQSC